MHRIARALAILGSATALATAPSAKGEPHEYPLAGDANLVFDPGAGVCRLEEADDPVDRMAIESQRSTTKGTPILFLALYVPCDVLWRHRTLGVLTEYAVLEAQPVPGREAFGSPRLYKLILRLLAAGNWGSGGPETTFPAAWPSILGLRRALEDDCVSCPQRR